MNRQLIRKNNEIEWNKIIYKNLIEEMRIAIDRIWKITYYTILIYIAIFAIINIAIDKNIVNVFSSGIFLIIFLVTSISFKIITRLYVDIIMFNAIIKRIQTKYRFIDYIVLVRKSVIKEEFSGIYIVLFFSFYILLIYASLYNKLGFWQFIFILIFYLSFEIPFIKERRKHLKDFTRIDILSNILLFAGLLLVFIITNFDVIKNIAIQFIKKI